MHLVGIFFGNDAHFLMPFRGLVCVLLWMVMKKGRGGMNWGNGICGCWRAFKLWFTRFLFFPMIPAFRRFGTGFMLTNVSMTMGGLLTNGL